MWGLSCPTFLEVAEVSWAVKLGIKVGQSPKVGQRALAGEVYAPGACADFKAIFKASERFLRVWKINGG